MQTTTSPQQTRESRRHTPKADMRGLYQRAIRESFIKLNPRNAVKNPVMFIVWIGTIIVFLVTLNPNLFGTIEADINQQRLLNGLITLILFFYSCFCQLCRSRCRRTW